MKSLFSSPVAVGSNMKQLENGAANKWLLLLIGLTACIGVSFLVASAGISGAVLLLVAIISIPTLYGIIAYPKFGILVFISFAYLLYAIGKFADGFPLGTMLDGLELFLIVSFFYHFKKDKDWSFAANPISYVVLVWVGYCLLQMINPEAGSVMAWLTSVRAMALVMLLFFIFVYYIDSVEFIRLIIKIWLVLSFFGALYGLKQEFIGFSESEMDFLNSDPNIASLLFIDGHWRKFSFFSDPVDFSYNMVVSSLLCIGLLTGPFSTPKKIVLGCLAGLFLFAMMFSGTRSSYVLLPAALVILVILKFNQKILLYTSILAAFMVVLIFIPTSNYTIYRFQTAFKSSKDASYNVRKINQKRIQPYILSHPMGGGLGSTGASGAKYTPGTYLANFPPDSGHMRVAVEMGWIGLFIFCAFFFIALKTGISNYFLIRDKELKTYCFAMVMIVFALNIASFPQEAINKLPTNVLFTLVLALIVCTYRIDQRLNGSKTNTNAQLLT